MSALWKMNFSKHWSIGVKQPMMLCFSRTMTPDISAKRPNNGNITVFKWPTQSPDLNPIKNL